MKRDIVSVLDMRDDFEDIIERSIKFKRSRYSESDSLRNRVLGMIFEKPSTRTRVSLETAIVQLGGHGVYLNPHDMQLGRGETIEDTAKVLSGMLDAISYRAFHHSDVLALARNSTIPVINALDDLEHPVQMLADFMTIYEAFGRLDGLKIAYVGDGNNVANSLMLASAIVGSDFSIGCPKGYEPNADLTKKAEEISRENGTHIDISTDPRDAVSGANVIYTDVWVSMGEEKEREQREKLFRPYQVNADLADNADRNFIFLHCLPAHRGLEVSAEVIDGVHSRVFQEAENRLHTSKGLLWTLLH
ncbi:MAG: ornithine carbamoyltransferase [Thermoplasmataceae archaeon]